MRWSGQAVRHCTLVTTWVGVFHIARRVYREMFGRKIVIVGAGYVGLNVARRLQRKLRRDEGSVIVIDQHSYMTYQPLLSDAAAGTVEPRHVVVPLRHVLDECQVVTGRVMGIDNAQHNVTVAIGEELDQISYDVLIVAPGSVSKIFPVPGLAEEASGFTTLGEAIYLRNHVLSQLDKAASTQDHAQRTKLLTFVLVGGGYAGVEALGQLEEMARFACRRYYPNLRGAEMRWVLVEAADRIMPEVNLSLAEYAADVLRKRGMDVYLETTTKSVEDGHVVLSNGVEFDADTIVWTTGVVPNPVLDDSDLPRDNRGRLVCTPSLEVWNTPGVFGAGDAAAVPDLTSNDPDATCAPSAQHATRQARLLADNIVASLRGKPMHDYRHRFAGSVAALGHHQGVAEVYGRKLTGLPAWTIHRLYHVWQMPTINRRLRILADWVLDLSFPRIVALGELHEPAAEFEERAHR